ncbi:MAG TPA: Rap1a/Tai family immunity protein [Thermoanaerobaculia bacterium]|nr:Rap1a/Tai family immunity protein [Thermoanaerobaculia bacterium]
MKLSVGRVAAIAFLVSVCLSEGAWAAESPLLKLGGLVKLCERQDTASRGMCAAYISGFVAGSEVTRRENAIQVTADRVQKGEVAPSDQAMDAAANKAVNDLRIFCIRSEWTAQYVSAVVVQYGHEHTAQLNEATSDHMLKILQRAFPCE